MNNEYNNDAKNSKTSAEVHNSNLSGIDAMESLSQYFKSGASTREGRPIPPLENWHPDDVSDMDLVIKSNGEWWHEGGKMTRESLVSLFATILWKEDDNGVIEYFLKTPVQKLRIQVEDVPLFINDVGIVHEGNDSWLEFVTTTGDVVRLDDEHPITLRAYNPKDKEVATEAQVRPYMSVRNGLIALIGRNAFYHLTEIGELTEQNGETILTLQSGGKPYQLSMPIE